MQHQQAASYQAEAALAVTPTAEAVTPTGEATANYLCSMHYSLSRVAGVAARAAILPTLMLQPSSILAGGRKRGLV